MPREKNAEIERLVAEGLSRSAAKKRVQRMSPYLSPNADRGTSENVSLRPNVPLPDGRETNGGVEGQKPVKDVSLRESVNVPLPSDVPLRFQRRKPGESADEFNARWEAWTEEHGVDPSGKKPGWETTKKPGMVWFTGETIETDEVTSEGRLVCVKGEHFVLLDGTSVPVWRRVAIDKDAKEPEGGYVTRHTETKVPPLTLLKPDGRFDGIGRMKPVDGKGGKMVLVSYSVSEGEDRMVRIGW